MLTIEWDVVLFFALGILLLYGLGWLLLVPLRKIAWFLLNSVVGIVVLLLLNGLSPQLGITAAANPFSAVITGFLGLPGVALVLVLQNLL